MKKMILAVSAFAASLLIASSLFASSGPTMELPILGDVDGDTIATALPIPCPLCKVSIRILGVDTPEKGKRAKCENERILADKASSVTRYLIGSAQTMTISNFTWDKYGGRIDANVTINGRDIATELLRAGVAVPYNGGKKISWCQ